MLAIIAAACGGSSGSDGAGGADAHNDADVAFAQEMVAHHEQAVVMAQMGQDQASSDAVRDLATRIENAQGPEIETMQTWLEEWGESEDSGEMGGMDHGETDGAKMSGMMTDEEMSELASAGGKEFDRMFLTMMIEHHEGAISSAEEEVESGEVAEAIDLAESIKSTQEKEVEEMQSLLKDLG